jgi:hypothetical protein
VTVVSALAVAAGALLLHRALRRLGWGAVAGWTTLLVVLATPAPSYAIASPAEGHAVLFLGGAAALAAWARRRASRPSNASGLRWGLGLGLGLATFEQAADLGRQALAGARPHLVLEGGPFILESLFSSRQGLLFWTPVAWLAVAGLAPLARRDGATFRLVTSALLVIAAASAFSSPWWSGDFGNGRFAPALPILGVALAAALHGRREWAARRPLSALAIPAAALVAWNLVLMQQYRREMIPRDDTVAFPVVAENQARLVSQAVGSPLAWPAAWVFARQTGLPASRYDLAVGRYLFALPGDLRGTIDVGDAETDAALLVDGWSVRHPCQDQVCRAVESRARVLAPLDRPEDLDLHIRVEGSGELALAVNEVLLGRRPISPTLDDVSVPLAASLLRRGLNPITLSVSAGSQALVDRLVFTRVGARP